MFVTVADNVISVFMHSKGVYLILVIMTYCKAIINDSLVVGQLARSPISRVGYKVFF